MGETGWEAAEGNQILTVQLTVNFIAVNSDHPKKKKSSAILGCINGNMEYLNLI